MKVDYASGGQLARRDGQGLRAGTRGEEKVANPGFCQCCEKVRRKNLRR
jgi:hypothetical protein